ncbi:MAG TPA: tetratricopeptide repeat protein, partial [Desulfomonilaceae bacterium]|nr:tetratricopeptide repeat protein [Desulfomonilaceae bacterium]
MAALIQVVVLGIAIVLLAGDVVWPITLSTGPVPEYLFAEGLKRYQAGELDGASETWENVFSEPTYGPVAYILLARARQKLNEHAKAETLVQDFLKKHPDSVYQNLGQELLADALYHQNNPKAASLLSHMIAKAPDKDKPGLTLRLAELEKRLGNYPSAASHYRSLFLNYPASVEGLKAGDDLAWMVFHSKVAKPEFSESEQLARGGRLFAKGRFDLAAETYQALLKTKPGDKQLTLKLARCKFKDRQNNKAIAILKEMLKGEVSETDKMEALHLLSLVYWRIDRDKDFELCCNVLTEKAPPKLKRKALFNLGVHHMERKRFADADACFKRLLNTLPEPSMKADVKWKTAWIKYWERKYTDAAAAFGE